MGGSASGPTPSGVWQLPSPLSFFPCVRSGTRVKRPGHGRLGGGTGGPGCRLLERGCGKPNERGGAGSWPAQAERNPWASSSSGEVRLHPGDYTVDLTNPAAGTPDSHLLAGNALFSPAGTGSGGSTARIAIEKGIQGFHAETRRSYGTPGCNRGTSLERGGGTSHVDFPRLSFPESLIRIVTPNGADIFRGEVARMESTLADLTLTEALPG